MNDYLQAQIKTNEIIINGNVRSDELQRFSKADLRWAVDKENNKQSVTQKIRRGEIYQFEFGKNFLPEISYEHRGLVIGTYKKMLYVLPIYSYDSKKHRNIYDPTNPTSTKSDLYLLKQADYSFLKRDSILKLDDLRAVSKNRIIYQQPGRIDPASAIYKEIESMAFGICFPNISHDFNRQKKECTKLQTECEQAKEQITALQNENAQLKSEIESLKKRTQRSRRNKKASTQKQDEAQSKAEH